MTHLMRMLETVNNFWITELISFFFVFGVLHINNVTCTRLHWKVKRLVYKLIQTPSPDENTTQKSDNFVYQSNNSYTFKNDSFVNKWRTT